MRSWEHFCQVHQNKQFWPLQRMFLVDSCWSVTQSNPFLWLFDASDNMVAHLKILLPILHSRSLTGLQGLILKATCIAIVRNRANHLAWNMIHLSYNYNCSMKYSIQNSLSLLPLLHKIAHATLLRVWFIDFN